MADLTDSGPPPSDDIGRKRETPMDSTSAPKEPQPRDATIAGADERLAHAYEEIKRADEQLTQMSERLAKIEGEPPRPPAAAPAPQSAPAPSPAAEPPPTQESPAQVSTAEVPPPQSLPARPVFRSPMALLLASCFIVTALVLSVYDGGVVARWASQPAATPSAPPEGPTLAAQSAPSTVQVASAETAPALATPQDASPQPTPPQTTPPQATSLAQAQTAPQDAAPPAVAAPPDQAQLLQKIARDLATLEQNIEQLKANQQQMATDNSKAIGELKASQEEMKRTIAKVSDQPPPRASAPATQPAPVVRRPERTYQPPPQARARPRYYPREWIYDDW